MFQQKDYMPKHEYPQCGGCTAGVIKEPTGTAGIKSNDPWDNLKVGSQVMWNNNGEWNRVIEVTKNLFAIYYGGEVRWYRKSENWTIKDSTPKEEEALEVGSLYLNGKTHLWRLLLDGTFQFFDDSNWI